MFTTARCAAALAICMTAPAFGQTYIYTIESSQSAVNGASLVEAPIPGTVIGNYDARTNPTGTRTLPGIFGGTGNQPIPFSITVVADGELDTNPAGGFTLDIVEGVGAVTVTNFHLDLLNGSPGSLALVLELFYQTFHTVNPTALFLGGFVLPLPLGDIALTKFELTQTGDISAGVLLPADKDEFSFTVALAAEAVIEIDLLGQPQTIGPFPLPLVLNGTLNTDGGGGGVSPTITSSIALGFEQEFKGPFPFGSFENVELDVATILPPGQTAHLFFSGEMQSISMGLNLESTLVSSGWLLGDLALDGKVDVDDLLALLRAWGSCGSSQPSLADLDGDAAVDAADLALLLGNWG